MSTTSSLPTAETPPPLKHQRALKWMCAGLGSLLIGGIVYSQPLGREIGVHVLGSFGPRAIPWLLSSFEDSDQNVRRVANETICNLGPAAVPNLLVELKNSRPAIRADVVTLLSLPEIHVGQKSTVSAGLLKLLGDNNRLVQMAAINAIATLGDAASLALPQLMTLLDDQDAETRIHALHAVVAIDRDSDKNLSVVLRMLKDAEPKVRADACSMLENIGTQDPRAVAALIEALHDPAPEVRAGAADYLGEIGPAGKVAIPTLEVVAETDPNPDVRSQAAQSIKSLRALPAP